MKRLLMLICTVIIMSQFLIGCSANKNVEKNVEFKEFFSRIIGFSENDEKSKPIQQDTILMLTNEDFQTFKDKYFTPREFAMESPDKKNAVLPGEIPMESPDKEKAVLFLQIPSPTSSVKCYSVKSINVSNNTLTVNLNQSGSYEVDGIEGFDGTWKWVTLIEVDKTNLNDNMKIVVNK